MLFRHGLFFALAIRSAKKYTLPKRETYAALAVRVSGHVDNFLYKAAGGLYAAHYDSDVSGKG